MNTVFYICVSILLLLPHTQKNKTEIGHPYGKQHCILVTINDQSHWLIVDSGASLSLISETFVETTSCKKGETLDMQLVDMGGAKQRLSSVTACSIVLDHQVLPEEDWFVFPQGKSLTFPERDNKKLVGIMGMNCLRRINGVIHFGDPVTLTYTLP